MSRMHRRLRPLSIAVLIATTAFTSGCPQQKLTAFDPDGILEAQVRRTDFGVPHIQAQNLESLAFGVGYAYAQDNICVLQDLLMKYNSRRSQYLGPDRVPGSGDAQHLINDFGFLALEVRAQAEAGINTISDNQRALLSGYSKGVNHYLEQTGSASIDPACAGQPWVQPITEVDLLTSLLATALLPGSMNFLGPIFLAAPPGENFAPFPATASMVKTNSHTPAFALAAFDPDRIALPETNPQELGSNGWAIGAEKSVDGRGLLLANPHFPHTGNLRFWQLHTTIPGVLDVMGASIAGTPGIVNIGFNEHLAWTHTFSTAEHVIAYQLALDPVDPTGLSYIVDGVSKAITRKTLSLDVAVAPGVTLPFSKHVYYSEFGPLFVVPNQMPWGTNNGQFSAFALKDANRANPDIVDHWLGMNLARNLDEFKAAFQQYDGVIFNNTMAADDRGNAFYIDDSTVPQLSDVAEQALRTNPQLQQLRKLTGFSILPGNSAVFDFSSSVPYDKAPQLQRRDFVQNSNDSFWLTNPAQPLTNASILYGKVNNQQTLRSRMGQKLLQDSAGTDGKFTARELETALFSQRGYLVEAVLDDLLIQCQNQGETPVPVMDAAGVVIAEVNVADACAALSQWDRHFHRDSRGALVFREFAMQFGRNPQWTVPFDATQPLDTPHTLQANSTTLQQLAQAVLNLQAANIAPDAELGAGQFVQRTQADGTLGERFPWAGTHNIEGGFNVFRPVYGSDGSLLPRRVYTPLPGTELSAEAAGYAIDYGSSWMMIVDFTRHGPRAKGLMTYSQSTDYTAEHALDQTRLYSEQPRLHPLPFREREVAARTQSKVKLRLDTRVE